MHMTSVESQNPHIGGMWKLGDWNASSGITLFVIQNIKEVALWFRQDADPFHTWQPPLFARVPINGYISLS
ncbi:hypothetical protein TNCV_4526451 [Trichonephila clavipes]|nr:hypothetical protein TNCV_4526451 [Trichonephila clavipes]